MNQQKALNKELILAISLIILMLFGIYSNWIESSEEDYIWNGRYGLIPLLNFYGFRIYNWMVSLSALSIGVLAIGAAMNWVRRQKRYLAFQALFILVYVLVFAYIYYNIDSSDSQLGPGLFIVVLSTFFLAYNYIKGVSVSPVEETAAPPTETPQYWARIEQVRAYLASKQALGITQFQQLVQKVTDQQLKTVIITFTYEHLEVLEKQDDQLTPNYGLVNTLNRYEIEELIRYDYNADHPFEDFEHSQLQDITSKMIHGWLADCFHQALEGQQVDTLFYFKENHDQLEIFELNTCQTWYEQTEFDTFVHNNQQRTLSLLPS